MKVVIPRGFLLKFLFGPIGKVFVAVFLVFAVVGLAVFSHYWTSYARLIDRKLSQGPFNTPSKIFAAPEAVYVGQPTSAVEIVSHLRSAGYSESSTSRNGWYRLRPDANEN